MSYYSRSCRRRFTILNFKIWALSRICGRCQQNFTAHAQKRLYRNFQLKFRRFSNVFRWFLHFISWKFAVFLLMLHFTHCAKFEVDMAIHCQVIAFLLLICCVTLTFDLMTLTSSHTRRVTWSTLPKRQKILCLSVLEMSYNVFHWLLLKMRFRLLRMSRITWPVCWS